MNSLPDSVCILTAKLDRWGGHLTSKITLCYVSCRITVPLAGLCLVWDCIVVGQFMLEWSPADIYQKPCSPKGFPLRGLPMLQLCLRAENENKQGRIILQLLAFKRKFQYAWKARQSYRCPLFPGTHPEW